MPIPPAHHTRFAVRFSIAAYRVLCGRDPRQVEIGLMAMRGLDEAGADRGAGRPLLIDEVPVVVGSLEERVHAAR